MSMSINEAIENARKKANEMYMQGMLCHANPNDEKLDGIIECAKEQEQLAEWLEELKMYKSLAPRELVSEKQKNDRAMEYSKGFNYGFKTGYNKAIDDFHKKIDAELRFCSGYPNCCEYDYAYEIAFYDARNKADEIAEQLKAGDNNG